MCGRMRCEKGARDEKVAHSMAPNLEFVRGVVFRRGCANVPTLRSPGGWRWFPCLFPSFWANSRGDEVPCERCGWGVRIYGNNDACTQIPAFYSLGSFFLPPGAIRTPRRTHKNITLALCRYDAEGRDIPLRKPIPLPLFQFFQ